MDYTVSVLKKIENLDGSFFFWKEILAGLASVLITMKMTSRQTIEEHKKDERYDSFLFYFEEQRTLPYTCLVCLRT